MSSALCLDRGGRFVELEELNSVPAPPPEGRWFPLSHGHVLTKVRETLTDAGYAVEREQLGLSADSARFFGVMDLTMPLVGGVTLAVGVRNSIDKSFPIGFCAGSRVFCCDNLAFRAELLVRKKHTRFGEMRFAAAIGEAVVKLAQFKDDEAARVRLMQTAEVPDDRADSLILRAFEKGIVPTPALPRVIHEWREPQFEDFRPRTLWSLFNAFTTVLGERAKTNAHAYAAQTMRLSAHLTAGLGSTPALAV
jgi:hypothetical protein